MDRSFIKTEMDDSKILDGFVIKTHFVHPRNRKLKDKLIMFTTTTEKNNLQTLENFNITTTLYTSENNELLPTTEMILQTSIDSFSEYELNSTLTTEDYYPSTTSFLTEFRTENYSTTYRQNAFYNRIVIDRRQKTGTRTRTPNENNSDLNTTLTINISSFSVGQYRNGSLIKKEKETAKKLFTDIEFYDLYEYYDSDNNSLFVKEINDSTHKIMSEDFYNDLDQSPTNKPTFTNIYSTETILDILEDKQTYIKPTTRNKYEVHNDMFIFNDTAMMKYFSINSSVTTVQEKLLSTPLTNVYLAHTTEIPTEKNFR